jgi:hypothetical protein
VPVTGAEAPIKALRRAGLATLAAEGLFGALCVEITSVHAVRITSPWGADPYDAVVSCAIMVLPLVAFPTAVRLVAHRRSPSLPAAAARAVLAGCLTGLACMAVALVACSAALTGVPDAAPPLARALLTASVVAGVVAARLTLGARARWQPALARLGHLPAAARPDLADEIAALVASLLPGSLLAQGAAWLDRGLDVWRISPRRHPWAAVVTTAWGAGVLLAEWHAMREGPWAGLRPALVFAGTVAVTVGVALAVGVVWLGLLRPAASARPASRPSRPAALIP